MRKNEAPLYEELISTYVGFKVIKRSGKPFKSKSKVNTVKGIITHPIFENKYAVTFLEDDSFVELGQCTLV